VTISYTTASWNPLVGCRPFSWGCLHCYAARQAGTRLAHLPAYQGLVRNVGAGEQPYGVRYAFDGSCRVLQDRLDAPLQATRPQRYFVCSTSDVFYEGFEDHVRDQLLARMLLTPWHTYLITTKRPALARGYLSDPHLLGRLVVCARSIRADRPNLPTAIGEPGSALPPWIWMGVSVEDDAAWRARVPILEAIGATRKWVSLSPLLELPRDRLKWSFAQWVVIEGESGPSARPYDLSWGDVILDECRRLGIPAYHKQVGSNPRDDVREQAGQITHPSGADVSEWPEDLRVRQMPEWYASPHSPACARKSRKNPSLQEPK